MLKSDETKDFLDKAQRLSADWTAQVQFIREEFLPQLEVLNQRIAQRSHVPDLSRDILTSYMQKSNTIAPYIPRCVHIDYSNNSNHRSYATVHPLIESQSLLSMLFSNDMLSSSLEPDHDLALYFDAQYKALLLGISSASRGSISEEIIVWNRYDEPARIYTNYDFYVEMKVNRGVPIQRSSYAHSHDFGNFTGFQELTTSSNSNSYRPCVNPVPLSGCRVNRNHISFSFVSLGPTPTPALVDPTPTKLAAFLAQRKPQIHAIVVLDYLRDQPLSDVSAFFGDVSQYDLAEAKNTLCTEKAAHSHTMSEFDALKEVRRADAVHLRGVEETCRSQAQDLQQMRSKQNVAALRIRKLETKLLQSERLYEDLLTQESLKSQSDLELQLGRLMGESRALDAVTLVECEDLSKTLKNTLEKVEAKAVLLRERQSENKDQRMCVVCQEHAKSVVVLPCRHLCLCSGCSAHHLLQLCPLCREPIVDKIKVFA